MSCVPMVSLKGDTHTSFDTTAGTSQLCLPVNAETLLSLTALSEWPPAALATLQKMRDLCPVNAVQVSTSTSVPDTKEIRS